MPGPVEIKNRDYWVKVVWRLQQNWAIVETEADNFARAHSIVLFCRRTRLEHRRQNPKVSLRIDVPLDHFDDHIVEISPFTLSS